MEYALNLNDPPVNPLTPRMELYLNLRKKLRAKKRAQLELYMTADRRKDVTDLLIDAISSRTVRYCSPNEVFRRISRNESFAKRLEEEIFQLAYTVADYYRILAVRKWGIEMVVEAKLKRLLKRREFRRSYEDIGM